MKKLLLIVPLALMLVLVLTPIARCADPVDDSRSADDIRQSVRTMEAELVKIRQSLRELEAQARQGDESLPTRLTKDQIEVCEKLKIDQDQLLGLLRKPLYEFSESEVDLYLRYLQKFMPKLSDRVRHLARKNIGQPYDIYLLGEMPFEHYDPQPIYCLTKSDCLVFCEHTYAMALTNSWPRFVRMLQRIRYADGQIGVATRNHYTEADWNPNNNWLVRDMTEALAKQHGVKFKQKINRSKFLRGRYNIDTDIPVEERVDMYLPYEYIDQAKSRLRDGDFVNIVRGVVPKSDSNAKPGTMEDIFGGSAWVGHTGMIVIGDNGEVHLIHSTQPQVREEPIDEYIARSTENNAERDAAGKARLLGFKFLRLQNNPLDNLKRIDGRDTPKVTLPEGGLLR